MAQFTANRKGYDPDQVDQFIATQTRQLQDAVTRAASAEAQLSVANASLVELQDRLGSLEEAIKSGAEVAPAESISTQLPTSIELPETANTVGEQIQRIIQEAWESASAIRISAEQEIAARKQGAETELAQIIRQRDSTQSEIDQARTQADMKLAEAKDEAERSMAARREALEIEMARKRGALEELETNKENEIKLRIEEMQQKLQQEHQQLKANLEHERQDIEKQIHALNDEREHALADLQKLQDTLRQAVGGIDIPGLTASHKTETPAAIPEPPKVEPEVSAPKTRIEPLGASSVPFDEEIDNPSSGSAGGGEVMMVPTIAGLAAVPVDGTGAEA
ncbi:MAG: hypothetical protein HKL80_05990 [Acidimicrobiales bacterium]|nr:hypothetical protein [Acidimicrobiales bacterium]